MSSILLSHPILMSNSIDHENDEESLGTSKIFQMPGKRIATMNKTETDIVTIMT